MSGTRLDEQLSVQQTRTTTDNWDLLFHLKGSVKLFECGECHTKFNNLGVLRAHLTQAHPTENRNGSEVHGTDSHCTLKDETNSKKRPLDLEASECGENSVRHTAIEEQCGKTASSENPLETFGNADSQSLQLNYRPRVDDRVHACLICNKTFFNKHHLDIHFRTHTGEKPFECSVCPKAFRQKSHLLYHLRVHRGDKPYKCSICQQTFTGRTGLKYHLQGHIGEKPFECSVCRKAFSKRDSLNRHSIVHINDKPFRCSTCAKTFSEKSSLEHHIRTHGEEKRFVCSLCLKAFGRKGNLKDHLGVHKEKLNKCTVCDKAFRTKSKLKSHHRTHTDQKPYKCSICYKAFRVKLSLAVHNMTTHTAEKRSESKQCACRRALGEKSNLVTHFRSQSADKPCKCSSPLEASRSKSQLEDRAKILTANGNQYKCTVCLRVFKGEETLKTHLKAHLREWQSK